MKKLLIILAVFLSVSAKAQMIITSDYCEIYTDSKRSGRISTVITFNEREITVDMDDMKNMEFNVRRNHKIGDTLILTVYNNKVDYISVSPEYVEINMKDDKYMRFKQLTGIEK